MLGARGPGPVASPLLTMAIPKKLVPSSPVRNLVRRVIRESHRAALAREPRRLGALRVRVQLQSVPQESAAPTRDAQGRALRPFARRPTDRALKRRVRAELDALFARLAARAG